MSQPNQITAKQVKGDVIYDWRAKISAKYSKLPGIRELHDFIIVRLSESDNETATVLVREWCYSGTPKKSPLKLNSSFAANINVFPCECYDQLNKTHQLTEAKLTHLTQMCQNFIPEERWLDYITKTN